MELQLIQQANAIFSSRKEKSFVLEACTCSVVVGGWGCSYSNYSLSAESQQPPNQHKKRLKHPLSEVGGVQHVHHFY